MRAEHRRQAAVVAEARCARRDATHNDAFEHLLWLHSCSGSLGVMNARRLSHLKHAGAWAALQLNVPQPGSSPLLIMKIRMKLNKQMSF